MGLIDGYGDYRNCLNQICDAAMAHYANNCPDVRKCPRADCTYFGVIPMKTCKENLNCQQCGAEWREEIHISTFERVQKRIRNIFTLNSEAFSELHNVLFEEPCPRCGVLIQKNGGCKHMQCGKCKHEFCWLCLGSFYSYVH